jgi:hypothetical protein
MTFDNNKGRNEVEDIFSHCESVSKICKLNNIPLDIRVSLQMYPTPHLMNSLPRGLQKLPLHEYAYDPARGVTAGCRVYPLDVYISEEQYQDIRRQFPNINVVYQESNRMKKTDHPYLRVERALGEELICRILGTGLRVIDIGGNPNRHFSLNRFDIATNKAIRRPTIHTWVQPINARKVLRQSSLRGAFCTCGINNCFCQFSYDPLTGQPVIPPAPLVPNFDVGIMIHHLYYYNNFANVLATMLTKGITTLWSLHHRFEDNAGEFGRGEMKYTTSGPGGRQAFVKVKGEEPFMHSSLRWLNNKYYGAQDLNGNNIVITYEIRYQLDNSEIGVFNIINSADHTNFATPDDEKKFDNDFLRNMKQKELKEVQNIVVKFASGKSHSKYGNARTYIDAEYKTGRFKYVTYDEIAKTMMDTIGSDREPLQFQTLSEVVDHSLKFAKSSISDMKTKWAPASVESLERVFTYTLNHDRRKLLTYYDELKSSIKNNMQPWHRLDDVGNSIADFSTRVKRTIDKYNVSRTVCVIGALLMVVSFFILMLQMISYSNGSYSHDTFLTYFCAILIFLFGGGGTAAVVASYIIMPSKIVGQFSLFDDEMKMDTSDYDTSEVITIYEHQNHDNPMYQLIFDNFCLTIIIWFVLIFKMYGGHYIRKYKKKIFDKSNAFYVRTRTEIIGMCYGGLMQPIETAIGSYIHNPNGTGCRCFKPMAWLYGPAIGTPILTSQCGCNGEITLNRRALKARQEYSEEALMIWDAWVGREINNIFGKEQRSPLTRSEWIARLPTPAKREAAQRALDIVLNDKNLMYAEHAKYSTIKAFLKVEALLQSELKAPRLIQGRYDEFNALWGNFAKTVSKYVASIWKSTECVSEVTNKVFINPLVTYCSGYTPDGLGKVFHNNLKHLDAFPGKTVAIELDFSRYDMSQNKFMENTVIKCMKHLVTSDWLSDKAMDWVLQTVGRLSTKDKTIKYGLTGDTTMRKSGDQHTSVGNSILTGLLILYILSIAMCGLGVDKLIYMAYRAMILGDDTVLLVKEDDAPRIMRIAKRVFKQFGVIAKLRLTTVAEVTFCSGYFVPCSVNGEDSYVLTRKIGRVLGKTFFSKRELPPSKACGHSKAVASALYNDFYHIPFMRSIFRKIMIKYSGINRYKLADDEIWNEYHRHVSTSIECTEATEGWFEQVYGMDRADMEELYVMVEQSYDGGFGRLNNHHLDHIFEVDNGYAPGDVDGLILRMQAE